MCRGNKNVKINKKCKKMVEIKKRGDIISLVIVRVYAGGRGNKMETVMGAAAMRVCVEEGIRGRLRWEAVDVMGVR